MLTRAQNNTTKMRIEYAKSVLKLAFLAMDPHLTCDWNEQQDYLALILVLANLVVPVLTGKMQISMHRLHESVFSKKKAQILILLRI